ncbi:MAG: hypothetical protein QOK23_2426 [Gammaproteobacteria bacterium]|jgi:hypothetical protein|nr:hypothetical protein [Gammaproteobacteria bacterium]
MAKRKWAKRKRTVKAAPTLKRQWSAEVAKRSDALDLKPGVFTGRSARGIAQSLKKSAEASQRRKSSPFRSAMSMLNFEINRAGKGLSAQRRRVLENAKGELRKAFDRPARARKSNS